MDADYRNNVVYDWGQKACYGEFDRINFVGNYYKAGPASNRKPYLLFHDGIAVVMPGSLYVADNILDGEGAAPGVNKDNWRGMGYYYFERDTVAAKEPFPAPPVTTQPPEEAYKSVLTGAGAMLPKRDTVDLRIVDEVDAAPVAWLTPSAKPAAGPSFPRRGPMKSRDSATERDPMAATSESRKSVAHYLLTSKSDRVWRKPNNDPYRDRCQFSRTHQVDDTTRTCRTLIAASI